MEEVNSKTIEVVAAGFKAEQDRLIKVAKELCILDAQNLGVAVSLVGKCNEAMGEVDEVLGEAVSEAHQYHKGLVAAVNSIKKPFETAVDTIKEKIVDYAGNTEKAPAIFKAVSGVSLRDDIDVNVLDLEELVKAVAKGKLPIGIIKVDTGSLKKIAKAGVKHPSFTVATKQTVVMR